MHDQQWLAVQQACSSGAQVGPREGGSSGELPLESVDGAYLAALHSSLLGELRLEPLVVGLSDAYELCRWVLGFWQGGLLTGQSGRGESSMAAGFARSCG